MARYKFTKKNAVKYSAAIMTYLYGASLLTPQIVKANEVKVNNETNSVSKIERSLNDEEVKVAESEGYRVIGEDYETLSSDQLTIKVDTKFPNIIEYSKENKSIGGTLKSKDIFKINNEIYKPEVEFQKVDEKAIYTLKFAEINVVMTVEISIDEDCVNLNFTSIKENGEFLVKSIEIPNHNLVTIHENEEEADIAAARVFHVLKSDDYFFKFKDKAVDAQPVNQTMGIFENGQLSAAIENNVLDYTAQVYYQTTMNGNKKEAGLWNGVWTYREVESEIVELPFSKVVISDDKNNSGDVTWQDGAIGLRKHYSRPKDSDVVKDRVSHVAMNFGSLAQYPFDRLTDQVAKYSNYLDGFGQMMLIKGYQSEGHDSGHPDYGNNFNKRAGGLEEFNEMAEVVEDKYNTLVGVHINATEIYPEAKHFNYDVLEKPYREGWNWLDQSWYIDKRYDTLDKGPSGLQARLKELKEATSELDWVYVDVYRSNPFNEYNLQKYLMENDWIVATEWSGPMRRNVIWTHWADLTYDNGNITDGVDYGEQYRGTRSQIVRFVENEMKDVFPNDILLKGNKNKGFMGWSGDCPLENNIEYSVETFYNWTLPTKYMQHFPIVEWDKESHVKFEGNLESKIIPGTLEVNENGKVLGGKTQLIKDGNIIHEGTVYRNTDRSEDQPDKLLSKDNRVFIPYSEEDIENPDKIYAWNDFKEEKKWHLPKSWKEEGISTVYLYKTSDIGRELIEEISVVNGQIALNLEEKTPYVLYKGEVDETLGETEWSETSNIGDMGFDSNIFKVSNEEDEGWWIPSSTSNTLDHIKFEDDPRKSKGQTYAKVEGAKDGMLSQTIEIESGKDYSASVWTEIKPGIERDVTLEVVLDNGEKFYHTINATNNINYTKNSDKWDTYFQRIKVDFTVPENVDEITINLKVDEGSEDSYVYFDNVRVVEHDRSEEEKEAQSNHYFYEDFETVDEGWGPFIQGRTGPTRTHLSELHEEYTNDTIEGNWSLKTQENTTGVVMRTVPGLLNLKENSKYSIKFKYKFPVNEIGGEDKYGKYDLVLKTDKGGDSNDKLKVRLPKYEKEKEYGEFEYTFQTGDFDDYYLSFEKLSPEILVIDDLIIDEYDGEVDEAFPEAPDYEDEEPLKIPQKQMTATATSSQSSAKASNLLDGNVDTRWHTKYSPELDVLPQSVTIDLGKEYLIDRVDYMPRQDGNNNGRITKYNLEVSVDGINFNTVIENGTLDITKDTKKLKFNATKAKYVKLTALEGVNGYASGSEINVYKKEENLEINPEKIKNLTGESTENFITLNWEAPSNTEGLTNYIIYKDGMELAKVPIDETSYLAENLKANTLYGFKVVCEYSNGKKSRPLAKNFRTTKVSKNLVSIVNGIINGRYFS
ncbi:endo-alpha-N-acetylgalactosaminidase family protein [Clostridium tarantellae]|uniref:O-GlcNAcase NagJ n=1 Tax=Clostridium tarantellae TaxID=39493 RepID=A0A6I1MIJ3_9CLOT|nr:endo-alpha-N-acetylgalactosaminidase family protein [Clostridium tarantellae]MPQ43356.1 O-GlcNAcase NagJ [Clostridium tarantellae]